MPAFSLEWPPRLAHAAASMATRRSPTTPISWTQPDKSGVPGYVIEIRGFGTELEPRYIFRAGSLDQ